MSIAQKHGTAVIIISFVLALMLTVVPLPDWGEEIRPHWVMLVLVYWSMALPQRVSVGVGWSMGLLLDVANDAVLGQHALSLTVVAYLTLKFHQRLRLFPVMQQALTILVLLILHQLLALWISRIIGRPAAPWFFWMPSLLGMMIWPPVYTMLRGLRRSFRVS